MKQKILFVILVLCIAIAGDTFYTVYKQKTSNAQAASVAVRMLAVADGESKVVDLDVLAKVRPRSAGTRDIGPLNPILFTAVIKEAPTEIATSYLGEAFGILGVSPAPKVTHRMFVETSDGKVMPVYVWDQVVGEFTAGPTKHQFMGFHIYTYSKGPAIVVDGMN